jgi:uncharacterized membrane protein YsdA (DUF1294 family)
MVLRYSALTVALALVAYVLIKTQTSLDVLPAWLISINGVALLIYGYDKSIAGSESVEMRVPEKVLLLLAFIGGTVGAWIGMQVFRHKTSKHSFQQQFWLVVLLQIVLIVIVLVLARRLI